MKCGTEKQNEEKGGREAKSGELARGLHTAFGSVVCAVVTESPMLV